MGVTPVKVEWPIDAPKRGLYAFQGWPQMSLELTIHCDGQEAHRISLPVNMDSLALLGRHEVESVDGVPVDPQSP
jgi:hypothetical protein